MEALEDLIARYLTEKAAEETAREIRRNIGNLISEQLEHPEEGSKSHTCGKFRVTLKGVVNRRVDWALFDEVVMPQGVPQPALVKREIDVKGLRWMRENHPDTYVALSKAITATPGAIGVEVKMVEEERE